MRILFLFALLFSLPSSLIGQDFNAAFIKCCETKDIDCQEQTLKEWEETLPDDPELFTSYFNFHFNNAKNEILLLSKEKPNGKQLVLTDSTNQTAGYLAGQMTYDKKELKNAFDRIETGIEKFPSRLDMRFGQIYALGQTENWNDFTERIIKAIDYSASNGNTWTWTKNEKVEDGKDFFLSAIHDYQVQLYNTGNDDLLLNMRKIAQKVLDHYPNHVESLSNLSITHILLEEYDEAISALIKAEKINPKDFIVLSNIAQAYLQKGDETKALEYFEKTALHGDEYAKDFAKKNIEELKSKK